MTVDMKNSTLDNVTSTYYLKVIYHRIKQKLLCKGLFVFVLQFSMNYYQGDYMVFKKRSELNGEIDSRINVKGTIRPAKEKSRRQIKEQELLSLLRKIKPHIADSVMTASKIMKREDSADASKLKSAALLISLYKELLKDAYEGGDEDAEGTEVQPNTPVFSLKIVGNETEQK